MNFKKVEDFAEAEWKVKILLCAYFMGVLCAHVKCLPWIIEKKNENKEKQIILYVNSIVIRLL